MIGILTMSLGCAHGQIPVGVTSMKHLGAFSFPYDASEIVVGKATRVQRSYRLCHRNEKYTAGRARW